jgi:hypothetical protein
MVTVGIHEQYHGTSYERTTAVETLERFPKTQVTREFTDSPIMPQNLIPKIESACKEAWSQGLVAAWSFKPDPASVLNGKWRPYLEQLAAYLRDNATTKKTIVIIWHEPENDIPRWFTDAAHFVKVFNTCHDTLVGAWPGIVTCHAALGYRYADNVDITDAVAPKWKTKATINAIDIYSGRSFKLGTTLPELSGFKRWLAYVVGDRAYGVTERGFIADDANSELRAATIKREADWLRDTEDGRRCVLYIYWNTVGAENDPDIPLDERGRDALRYLMDKVNEPDPQPEPEPPAETIKCPLCNGTATVPAGHTYTIVKAS